MKTTTIINTHRHHGNAAISFGGPTIYLSQEQAAWLRDRLDELVKDIEHESFERSSLRPAQYPEPTVQFTAVAVSSNTNSFGLRQVILLAENGEGWKVHRTSQFCPAEGDVICDRNFSEQGFELCSRLTDLEPDKAKKILKELTKH